MSQRPKRNVHPIIKQLKKTRIDLGLSLDKLGEKSGYSGNHIWHVERGSINAKIAMIADIAEALGMQIMLGPK